MVMTSKIHPNEEFITRMTKEQLELFRLEVEIYDNPKRYLEALRDQLNRLEIKF